MEDLEDVTTRHSSSLQLPTSSALQNTWDIPNQISVEMLANAFHLFQNIPSNQKA
jgi:hypothetical protein